MATGTDARTMDFMEGGDALEYNPVAPPISAEQRAREDQARTAFYANAVRASAAKTAELNAQYAKTRAEDYAASMELNNYLATTDVGKAGVDWGLLPTAYKIVKSGIILAATGGIAAPDVAAEWKKISSIRSPAAAMRAFNEYKSSVAAFQVPDLKNDEFVAAAVVADRVLSDPNISNPQAVIANTLALAATGDVDAQRGAVVLARVASARISAGVSPGQALLSPQTPEQAAVVASITPQTVRRLTAEDTIKIEAYRSWWQRFTDWLATVF